MKTLVRYVLSIGTAAALLAGCGAGAPSSAAFKYKYVGDMLFVNGRPVTAARLSVTPRFMTMLPDRRAKSKNL